MNNVPLQQRTNSCGNLGVTTQDYFQVFLAVHVLKVDEGPVLVGFLKRSIGGGSVADQRGPDAGEGGYRVAHDAGGKELRRNFLAAKVVRRAAR